MCKGQMRSYRTKVKWFNVTSNKKESINVTLQNQIETSCSYSLQYFACQDRILSGLGMIGLDIWFD